MQRTGTRRAEGRDATLRPLHPSATCQSTLLSGFDGESQTDGSGNGH